MTSKELPNYQSPVSYQADGGEREAWSDAASKRPSLQKANPATTQPPSDAARLLDLLKSVDVDELETALTAIKTAKEQSLSKNDDDDVGYKFYKEKCLVYEDVDCFIYQRPDRKKKTWYFRIYDNKQKKPVVKSLKTEDHTAALASARLMYIDIKGKIERGERLKQITTPELVKQWLEKLEATITPIPHEGITEVTYKQKRSFMRRWLLYIEDLKLTHKTIDHIKPETTRDFASWLKALPKETSLHTGARSIEQINNNVSEVIRMYHQLAVREKYISADMIPQIDRLKYKINDEYKRDIFTNLDQYDKYILYLKRNYCTKKHNLNVPPDELEKRKIFTEFILILSNAGFRPKELLGMKFNEIYQAPTFTTEEKQDNIVMLVRRTNSKTGRERRVVAPVKKRIDRIIAAYKKLGITHEPEDYLFINVAYKKRTALGRMGMYQRLKRTLESSGVQDQLDKEGKSISLYSFRHWYCYLRILNGVDFNLLSQNVGTSNARLHTTYGHINTELHLNEITKGQGVIKRNEINLKTLPILEDEFGVLKI